MVSYEWLVASVSSYHLSAKKQFCSFFLQLCPEKHVKNKNKMVRFWTTASSSFFQRKEEKEKTLAQRKERVDSKELTALLSKKRKEKKRKEEPGTVDFKAVWSKVEFETEFFSTNATLSSRLLFKCSFLCCNSSSHSWFLKNLWLSFLLVYLII